MDTTIMCLQESEATKALHKCNNPHPQIPQYWTLRNKITESKKARFCIIDCHNNFSNFLANTTAFVLQFH